MGLNSRRIKERAAEICDSNDYQEARDEEFIQQFRNFVEEFMKEFIDVDTGVLMDINEDDIQEFMDNFNFPNENDIQRFLNNFDFPDEEQWAIDEYESRRDSFNDQKYQEWKERDI